MESWGALATGISPLLVLYYLRLERMTKAHHVIVMGLNILGYLEGVPGWVT